MSKITTVESSHGVVFNVRLVEKGDRHGRNFCLTHDEDRPMVEFYDAKNPHSYDFVGSPEDAVKAGARCLGQFVSGYYVFTLLENIATTGGICLHGGVPKWQIDGDSVRRAFVDLGLWKPLTPMSKLIESYITEEDNELSDVERLRLMAERILEDTAGVGKTADAPFFQRSPYHCLSDDLRDYFFRMLGPMHALQAAYPFIDVSSFIASFEFHSGAKLGERPETLTRGVEPPVTVTPVKLVVVHDSEDPEYGIAVWAPRRLLKSFETVLMDSRRGGGVFRLGDGSHELYPDYIQLP